jgi:hypothetical protein
MTSLGPLPPVTARLVDPNGLPTQVWRQYLIALDALVRGLPVIGPLPSAVNDAQAANAGVAIGGLYQSGGIVKIRIS